MSAGCRIIHLHGGPSDGLCLAWQENATETTALSAVNATVLPEYDYIYVPRAAGKTRSRPLQLTLAPRQTLSRQKIWQRVWSACQRWLLAPSSYPLDTRHFQIPPREHGPPPNQP